MRITILSDSPTFPTGYSNQARLLCKYLRSKGHEIHYLANGLQGSTLRYAELSDGTKLDYNIYGNPGRNPYFQDYISHHLKEVRSDAFIILLDTFMLYGSNGWFNQVDTSPAQTFFWFPTDGGGGMPVGCDSILRKVDVPVAMAEFGKKQVKDYHNINSECIPHGTEPDRFYRLSDSDRIKIKSKYGLLGKFVIGVVARNQPRKMLDRTLKTMYYLKDKLPNAVLFLHLDPFDPAQIWYMPNLIKRYGLENRVIFTGMNALRGFDWSQMNEVYNAMDVFYLSTSGEGFGIPIIEAMSCEIPVVATDYTTTPELVINNRSGMGAKLAGVEVLDMFSQDSKNYDMLASNGTLTGSWEVERGMVDIHDAANKLMQLANDSKLRELMGVNGRKAVLEKYDFEKIIGPKWEALLKSRCKS